MVIIPFPLINLWVELHILINSSLDVQLIYQRFLYSKCGSIIFTTPYSVYSSHRTLIIAYFHYLQRAASHPPKERKLQKMIIVESEKWWWWWCVQNINTSYSDQNSWVSKSDMILVNRASGQENVVLHTQTPELWLMFYAECLAIFFHNVKALACHRTLHLLCVRVSPTPCSFQRNPALPADHREFHCLGKLTEEKRPWLPLSRTHENQTCLCHGPG